MKTYREITFIENIRRKTCLQNYRQKIEEYFQAINYDSYNGNIIDNENSKPIRIYLNKNLDAINEYLNEAGITATVIYTDPLALGGRRQSIQLLDNLFVLHKYDIEAQAILDFIDQALGIYEEDTIRSVIRTLNPFYWLGKLLELVANAPFYVLGSIGFDRRKAEESLMGHLIKWLIKVITGFTTLWQFLVFIGVIPQDLSLINLIRR